MMKNFENERNNFQKTEKHEKWENFEETRRNFRKIENILKQTKIFQGKSKI